MTTTQLPPCGMCLRRHAEQHTDEAVIDLYFLLSDLHPGRKRVYTISVDGHLFEKDSVSEARSLIRRRFADHAVREVWKERLS